MTSLTPTLPTLLDDYRDDLATFVRRHGGATLRYETPDDLLQGLQVRVLERGGEFEYRSREQFLKWLYTVTRTYLADRHKYWSALKRRSANLLRLTAGVTPSEKPGVVAEPMGKGTGPSTFAARREQLALAVKALAVLPDRDRKLVRWTSEGVDVREQGERLGLSYEAVRRARNRALDRFRKAYTLASGTWHE